MTREIGKGRRDLDGLWRMPRVEGIAESGLMYDKKNTAAFSRNARMMKNVNNKLVKSLEPSQEYSMRVANCPGFHGEVAKIRITEEIIYRTHSNAEPCENTILKAKITFKEDERPSMEVTMKFREAQKDSVTLTEKELRKAALIQDSPVVRGMFPSVYFVCVWTFDDGSGRGYWEGVAMESLNPVTVAMRERSAFNRDAASILRIMHREGFMHGDGHSGNFMIRPELPHDASAVAAGGASRADSGAHVSLRLVPIDFDMIRALPEPYGSDGDKYHRREEGPIPQHGMVEFEAYLNRLATKVMIIYDYNKLVFSNNLHMPFVVQREADATMRDLIDGYLMYQCSENDRQELLGPSILFMPWPFAFNWEKDYDWNPRILHATLHDHAPRLLQHIDGLSIADIDIFYLGLFQTSGRGQNTPIKELNEKIQKLFDEWRRQQPP